MSQPEPRATFGRLRVLLERIIQVRVGLIGGFPLMQDKADEMSRIAAEAMLVIGEAPISETRATAIQDEWDSPLDHAKLKVGDPCYRCGKVVSAPLSHLCDLNLRPKAETADEYIARCAREEVVPLARTVDRLRAAESKAVPSAEQATWQLVPVEDLKELNRIVRDLVGAIADRKNDQLVKALGEVEAFVYRPRRAPFDIEDFIRRLPWGASATEYEKALVAGNLRNLHHALVKSPSSSEPATLPEGWTVKQLPYSFKAYSVKSPDGCIAIVGEMDSNPKNVLFKLVEALQSPRSAIEGKK